MRLVRGELPAFPVSIRARPWAGDLGDFLLPDFNVLGIQMRGYSDVGVARGDKLAGLKVSGTPVTS